MTAVEVVTLADCESVIERTNGAFVECGTALALIRDERLYRGSFTTFEDYCLERWQMSRPHAYRLIEASEIAAAVSPIGDIANEGQARELTGLPAETQREVFAAAHEATAGKPTAAAIREARESIAPRPVTVKTTTTETITADPETGEVITAAEWVTRNADAALDASLEDRLSSTDDRFLLNLARGITSCHPLLNLSPDRAVQTCLADDNSLHVLNAFLDRMDGWTASVRSGLRPNLRSIK